MKNFTLPSIKKTVFSVILFIVLLSVVELILFSVDFFPKGYYTNTPNSEFTWNIKHNEIAGINESSYVKFDNIGARSISNIEDKKNKIAVFGGSTTACFALTQANTWTALLEKKLGKDYWVGNFARPGNSSNHHTLQFKHILNRPELSEVKTAIIMQGVNDFVGFLVSNENYLNPKEKDLKKISFQHYPVKSLPFYKRFSLYKLASNTKRNILNKFKRKDHLTKVAVDIKTLRKKAKLIDSLPVLTLGLKRYEANTRELIALAKAKNIRLIFTSQATMWKPNLEPEYEKLIMTSGFINNEAFYSTNAFYNGMTVFNQKLKAICEEENIDFIALDLPKTTATFYDDFHFNESGAALVSTQIYNYLKQ